MAYEYQKRLSEALYCHWFYWSTMCLNNLVFLVLNFKFYVRPLFAKHIVGVVSKDHSYICIFVQPDPLLYDGHYQKAHSPKPKARPVM